MNTREALYGPNVGYALELYDRYLEDPESIDDATRAYFEKIGSNGQGSAAIATLARMSAPTESIESTNGARDRAATVPTTAAGNGSVSPVAERPRFPSDADDIHRIVVAARLARGIREYGHLAADIDPLGAPRPGDPMLEAATHHISESDLQHLPASIVWPDVGPEGGTCLDAITRLRSMYSGTVGYDFDHVQDFNERAWLHENVEAATFQQPLTDEAQMALLYRLIQVDGFERFLHTTFQGQRRFSVEGTDALVLMLDQLVLAAGTSGTREVLIGMAHRGRLNVLAHILEKPYEAIFSEFHGSSDAQAPRHEVEFDADSSWSRDVKYHLGAQRTVLNGDWDGMKITLADNPSHLEFVNPAIEGFARAAQDRRGHPGPPTHDIEAALPVTIHGDAAFPGQGVVAETLNLSRLPGYQTGGTVRIIVNNQIGFTTLTQDGRSTLYASDLAKGFEIPIVHVNADDPEACVAVMRLAHAYRERFHRDVLIDLVGYRRWGHNEGDEPSFTQPAMYERVRAHPPVWKLYRDRLIERGVITADDAAEMDNKIQNTLREARERVPEVQTGFVYDAVEHGSAAQEVETAVPAEELRALNEALLTRPEGFAPNDRLERVLRRRQTALDEASNGIDWAHAETLAFASILADGTPIRLSGEDSERGTFSQRHLVLHDTNSGATYIPLQALPQARASFAVYNSPLSEAAVLGFEYGYTIHAPDALVLWEAQFGDFANAGQVVIDQFLGSARAKWREEPALVLLLPHGYEGQGPDHSSARVERFLQLAGEENLRVANCTSAAQYFHLLRLQAALLDSDRRPLVVMAPKSLLRQPLAASSLSDLAEGRFQPVVDDAHGPTRREAVRRLVLCSGKIAIDLTTSAKARSELVDSIAVARLEMLYPFPAPELRDVLSEYPNLHEVVWVQEEPQNMGAWTYARPLVEALLPEACELQYIGRPVRASTAEGTTEAHAREQARIIEEALGGKTPATIETTGRDDVS
jgi:2-oxoglutarate dehydrogenase E1 component